MQSTKIYILHSRNDVPTKNFDRAMRLQRRFPSVYEEIFFDDWRSPILCDALMWIECDFSKHDYIAATHYRRLITHLDLDYDLMDDDWAYCPTIGLMNLSGFNEVIHNTKTNCPDVKLPVQDEKNQALCNWLWGLFMPDEVVMKTIEFVSKLGDLTQLNWHGKYIMIQNMMMAGNRKNMIHVQGLIHEYFDILTSTLGLKSEKDFTNYLNDYHFKEVIKFRDRLIEGGVKCEEDIFFYIGYILRDLEYDKKLWQHRVRRVFAYVFEYVISCIILLTQKVYYLPSRPIIH